MKKTIYYLSPVVISPIILALFSLLDGKASVLRLVLGFCLCLYAVVMGNMSPSRTKFDYPMTAVLPLSLAFALFVFLLLDDGFSFSLSHALNFEYYLAWLPMFILTAFLTFVASFQPIRIKNKRM